MPKRFFICAGEVSGDKLAANLIQSIKAKQPDAIFSGVTGPEMEAQGCLPVMKIEQLSVMGLTETLKKLPFFIKLKRKLVRYICNQHIDVFIGVDFTEFNLSLEKTLKQKGITTCHYKSPSVWAWRKGRLKTIKQAVDRMLLLFPFEQGIYQEHQIDACYIGHPLADKISMQEDKSLAREQLGLSDSERVIAVLPGSRGHEIERLLLQFLQAVRLLQQSGQTFKYILPVATAKHRAKIETILRQFPDLQVTLYDGQSHQAMIAADLILLASGTATLEAMLLKRKMVVCYQLSALTYALFKPFMYIKRYALPNILTNSDIVPELIQSEVTPENIYQAMVKELERSDESWLPEFNRVHAELKCNAPEKAAEAILSL